MEIKDYEGIDQKTISALKLSENEILEQTPVKLTVHTVVQDFTATLANRILSDIDEALASGRERVAMIIPVGPVGQYDLIAQICLAEGRSLSQVTFILMDEYLTFDGKWISSLNPLSFRNHLETHLLCHLPEASRPKLVVPHPDRTEEIQHIIDEHDGLDVTYAGVGITGHLAFNEPLMQGCDPEWFGALPTRVVSLLPETRLINSVTAARGNFQCIPHLAVTVGMKEILSANKLRVWMNREWQSAAIRRMLFGPITGAFPASLIQSHANVTLDVMKQVLAAPEPGLA